MPRERIWCPDERKFKKYRQVNTEWEFRKGVVIRLRFCGICGALMQETEYKL